MTTQRQIPSVPTAVTDPVLKNFLSAVRDAVNVMSASVATNSAAISSGSSSASTGITAASIGGLSSVLNGLLDTSTPPAVTGLAVQGMRVNNFLTWNSSTYANLNYTEIWRAPALMNASSMTVGGAYTINVLGTTNWASIGATATAITALVNGTQYIITALGTINWSAIGAGSTPAVGSIFVYNGVTVTGTSGTVLKTNFTLNSTPITGTGGVVAYSPALSTAILVGTSNGHIFVDSVDPGSVYAYWVRFVSNASINGPFNSSTGAIGSTSTSNGSGVNGYNITAENLYAIQAWIASADILDASITNAKISGAIQSDNYNGSTQGWMLDKSGGTLNLNQLTIRDSLGNVILSSGVGVNWGNVLSTTGAPTRNVYAGPWATATNYKVGDVVLDNTTGNTWICNTDHTSGAITLPVYPVISSIYWSEYGVSGLSALTPIITNTAQSIAADSSGVVISYTGTNANISIEEGATLLTYDGVGTSNGTYKVTAVGTNITAGTLTGATTSVNTGPVSAMTSDTAYVTYTITGTRRGGVAFSLTTQQSFTKVLAGVSPYVVQIESTNGNEFRVGQGSVTLLIAHVFHDGGEVTSSISAAQFRWRRVSIINKAAPYDDATWNALYATGYKQISVSVDDVFSKATFFCDILTL
jgi:hypothetical protein